MSELRAVIPFGEWAQRPTGKKPWVCEYSYATARQHDIDAEWGPAEWIPCYTEKRKRGARFRSLPATFPTLEEAAESLRFLQTQHPHVGYRIRHAFAHIEIPLQLVV